MIRPRRQAELLVLALLLIVAVCLWQAITQRWDRVLDNPANAYSGAAIADDPTCPLHRAPPPRNEAFPAPLLSFLRRVDAQGPTCPPYKRLAAVRAESRQIDRLRVRVTPYCPGSPVDPQGGGLYAAIGRLLRLGDCAVDPRTIPLGSLLIVEGVPWLLHAVDTGGAVRGPHVDVCLPGRDHYLSLGPSLEGLRPCWVLRRGWGGHR